MLALTSVIQDSVTLQRFREYASVGTFETINAKVYVQQFHVFARNNKAVFLRRLAQRLARKLLCFLVLHDPSHRQVFRQRFRHSAWTNSQHVIHTHTNADFRCLTCEQTRVSFIALKPKLCNGRHLGEIRRSGIAMRLYQVARRPSNRRFGVHLSSGCAFNSSLSQTSTLRKACASFATKASCPLSRQSRHLTSNIRKHCCCCNTTFVTVRFFVSSRRHRVHSTSRHNVCFNGQVISVNLLIDFHAFQKVELLLACLQEGRD